jgi:hypothetical protein
MKTRNKSKSITARIALGAIMLCSNFIFAQKNPHTTAACGSTCGADAGANQTVCSCCIGVTIGGSDCSSGNNGCSGSQVTYSWAPSTGLSATNICQPTAFPASTTTYTLTVSYTCGSGCCCSGCTGLCAPGALCSGTTQSTSTVTVTVQNPPNCNCCRMANPEKQEEITTDKGYLFPNPTTGHVTVSVYDPKPNTTIQVYDVNGDAIYKRTIDENHPHSNIDLSGHAKGTYFVSVTSDDNIVYFKKVILQ